MRTRCPATEKRSDAWWWITAAAAVAVLTGGVVVALGFSLTSTGPSTEYGPFETLVTIDPTELPVTGVRVVAKSPAAGTTIGSAQYTH